MFSMLYWFLYAGDIAFLTCVVVLSQGHCVSDDGFMGCHARVIVFLTGFTGCYVSDIMYLTGFLGFYARVIVFLTCFMWC